MKKEGGADGWIALIFSLSFIVLIFGLTFDFRHEWNKRNEFNQVVVSVKDDFQNEGGLTTWVENEIINRLNDAGINTSNIRIDGTPQSNYGSKIYYIVEIDTKVKVGSDSFDRTYKKKVVGTSAWVPES